MVSRTLASGSLAAIAGAFALILAAPAVDAAVLPTRLGDAALPAAQLVAGNVCGPGRQMGQNGVCHPDSWFARRWACPPGMHLGAYGRRCWPN